MVELASNDGYLLRNFVEPASRCSGIDPAPGPAQAAAAAPASRRCAEFFDARAGPPAGRRGAPADVILANNVLAHVPDLNGFVAGMRDAARRTAAWP